MSLRGEGGGGGAANFRCTDGKRKVREKSGKPPPLWESEAEEQLMQCELIGPEVAGMQGGAELR